LMMKIGLVGAAPVDLTLSQGWTLFLAALPIAILGLISAIHQGKVCAAGVGLTVKKPEESMKAVVLAVFVEFYAVLGLLVTIFMVIGIKI